MSFMKLAAERYSVRKFSSQPVEPEKLATVLEAGRLAPTAANKQPQRIFVLQSEAALAAVRESTKCHFSAPVVLLICYDEAKAWQNPFTGQFSGEVDAAIVTSHMMLAAADLGLGTTWVGYFKPEPVIEFCKLPAEIKPVAMLPLGYPAADATPGPMHSSREPLTATVKHL
ncbi:MAG: nitroreductase [Lentisphaerae bacterium]|jgi:nitroreductase|nr:nitroreductase [Lentisphaerota bacterium]